jgi:hypothetical protein
VHNRREIVYPDIMQNVEGNRVWSLQQEMREITWQNNNEYDAVMAMALAVWPKRNRSLFPRSGPVPVRISTV